MIRTVLGGKIHRAVVTGGSLDYVGSITIDAELMEAAGIRVNEQVHVVNITTGARWVTYAIPGGPGDIILNGGGARLALEGDILVIMSYVQLQDGEEHMPRVVFVDGKNRICYPDPREG